MATIETETPPHTTRPPLDELDQELTSETGDEHDASPEQLALPVIDHRDADQVELAISGTIKLDRKDPADCALIRRLRLGEEVDLEVSGLVVERAGRSRHNEDGYLEGCTLKTKVKVTTVIRAHDDIEED